MAILKKRFFILIGIVFFVISCFIFTNFYQKKNSSNVVVIGSKNCTENQILAEIIATLIEKNTDIIVKRKFNLEGTLICFEALKSKDIDLYPEYTGRRPRPRELSFYDLDVRGRSPEPQIDHRSVSVRYRGGRHSRVRPYRARLLARAQQQ